MTNFGKHSTGQNDVSKLACQEIPTATLSAAAANTRRSTCQIKTFTEAVHSVRLPGWM